MSNNLSFVGHVANDPELKQVGQNDVLEFTVANNVGFGDRRSTNWFRCAVWGRRAVNLQPHLSKSKQVFVSGQLTLREYTNRDGEKRISSDVRVNELEFTGSGNGASQQNTDVPAPASQQNKAASSPETEEDMPF